MTIITKDKRRGSFLTEPNVSSPHSEPPPGGVGGVRVKIHSQKKSQLSAVFHQCGVVKPSSLWCDCTTSSVTSSTNTTRSQLHFDLLTFGPSKSPAGTKATDFRLCSRSAKRWLRSTSSPSTKRQLTCSAARLRRRASLQL